MATAYVVLNRPDLTSRDHFVLYVAVVDSKAAALEAVKAKFNPAGELEINGSALQASTLEALGLKPGEVRLL